MIPKDSSESEKIKLLDTWFTQLNVEGKFNGGLLYAKNHNPILVKTYGYTNHTKSEQLTNKSSFRLASISKQFTAAGIMLLKDRGLLDYDDSISKHLTEFPLKEVTIRHLLNQVSGIPDIYMKLAEQQKKKIGPILSIQKTIKLLCEQLVNIPIQPNEQFEYSNTNYILLAGIIERISGNSYENFMNKQLFQPLNMKNTRVWNLLSTDPNFANKTEGFQEFFGKSLAVTPSWIDGVAGDGGVFSSLEDLLIWDQFWYENLLISQKNLRAAFRRPTLNNGTISNYGFGMVVSDHITWHDGAWLAANSFLRRNTEKKTCLAILDNSSNICFNNILKELDSYGFKHQLIL